MSDYEPRARASFLGLKFDRLDQAEALAEIGRLAGATGFHYVVTPNVDHLVRLHAPDAGPALWQSYLTASLCLCDSQILRLLARWSGIDLDLVTGSDLTASLLERGLAVSPDIAVIGGDSGLVDALAMRFPAYQWHHHIPPMGVREDRLAQQAIVEFVERCPAAIFLFAIGSPQSELLCAEISRRGQAGGVALCIGASLEFLTGAKSRAPRWMQRAGLEWLFRLASEPRRLWRRYLYEGPAIFRIWWRWRLSEARSASGSGSSPPDAM
ncbi:MAG: WecB/TagA/CpsF family glycosyltransferase [Novosphingobium sp.]